MRAGRSPLGRCARAHDRVAPAPSPARELGPAARASARLGLAVARAGRKRAECTHRGRGLAPHDALGMRRTVHLGRPRRRRARGVDRERLPPRGGWAPRPEHALGRRGLLRPLLRSCASPREGRRGRRSVRRSVARRMGPASRGPARHELRTERPDDALRAGLCGAPRGARAPRRRAVEAGARARALGPGLRRNVLRLRDRLRLGGIRASRRGRSRRKRARIRDPRASRGQSCVPRAR